MKVIFSTSYRPCVTKPANPKAEGKEYDYFSKSTNKWAGGIQRIEGTIVKSLATFCFWPEHSLRAFARAFAYGKQLFLVFSFPSYSCHTFFPPVLACPLPVLCSFASALRKKNLYLAFPQVTWAGRGIISAAPAARGGWF